MLLAWTGLGAAVLILSLKTGLVLGMSRIKRRQVILFSLAFGLSLGILVMLFIPYQHFLVGLLDKYTFLGSLAMAVFLIYLGVEGERESQGENQYKMAKKYIVAFLPCPLCLIALALTVIILAPGMKISSEVLGWVVSGVFFGLLTAMALLFRKLMKVFQINQLYVLNSFFLFLGTFTLCCGLFIPNFVKAMSMPFSPVVVKSGFWTLAAVLGMIGLSLVGYMKYRFFERKGD